VDRSLSMRIAGRDSAGEAWIDRLEARGGWRVERDSFGGTTTDLAAAVARAEARLPDAIVVVSDGRAAGGRAAEPAGVPLYVHAPGPVALSDIAIAEVTVEEGEGGARTAVVEVAAVGGAPAPPRAILVAVNGRVVVRAEAAPAGTLFAPGERRLVRAALPPALAQGRAVVEARLEGTDPVPGNDRRARVTGPPPGPDGTLVVALRPGWEMGFVRRELAESGRVEALWAGAPGTLAPLDRAGRASWSALDPNRYRTAWLFGDPALLGAPGRAWIEAFAARGRGIAWLPAGYAGALPGTGAAAPGAAPVGSAAARGAPALTEAGRRALLALGAEPGPAPGDAGGGWPALELLPAAASPPPGAMVWFTAGGRPVAWAAERGESRAVVVLGTGWYRWPLAADEAQAAFWRSWMGALERWLDAPAAGELPLVRMPEGGRVARGDTLVAPLAEGGRAEWRVERPPGGGDGGGVVARGVVEADAPREVRAAGLPPGSYRLVVESGERAAEPFVVETWAPDLAGTSADTASLAAAARASGGSVLGDDPVLDPPARGEAEFRATRALHLGTTPWGYLLAVLLLLADAALSLARPLARG